MKVYSKILDVLEKIIRNVCGALVVGFTLITLVAVIARYVMSAPIWWSEQFCRYLFIWMLMLYFPLIVRHEQNLGFDVVYKRLPKKAQDLTWIFCHILIAGFGVCYFIYTIQLCQKYSALHKMTEGIRVPAAFMYSSQAVGAALLVLFTVEVIIKLIIRSRNGERKVN